VDAISGSSHGMSSSDRSRVLSGNRWWKNSARSMPIVNWPRIEPIVNSAVLAIVLLNRVLLKKLR